MIILGLDPGLAIVGWGVLESARRGFRVLGYGSVTTPANTPTEERLATIYSDMNELFMRFRPDAVSVEELFFSKNITGFLIWIQSALIRLEDLLYKLIK